MTSAAPSAIDSILAKVDLSPATPANGAEVISLEDRTRAGQAASKAFHLAMASGATAADAKSQAFAAYNEALTTARKPIPALRADGSDDTAPGAVDAKGEARVNRDMTDLTAEGFALKRPLFAAGSRVVDVGVENAKLSRSQWAALPSAEEACATLASEVRAERRQNTHIDARAIRMASDGTLLACDRGDKVLRSWSVEFPAVGQLVTNLGYGGGQYLRDCPKHIRALNVNAWCDEIRKANPDYDKPRKFVLRTREAANNTRSVFAVTSESYTPFDADKVAEAMGLALRGSDARGEVTYDGHRTRINALWHSDIKPEHYVAGEVFKAGVQVRTADDGTSSIKVSAVVWQNLCLNLIIINEAERRTGTIRHVGDVRHLAKKFSESFAAAQRIVRKFVERWGFACEDKVATTDREFEGVFRGILQHSMVKLHGIGAESAINALLAAWRKDASSATSVTPYSRAAVVNAFTRFAHETLAEQAGPWALDDVQADAGALLMSAKALPIVESSDAADALRKTRR